VIFMAYVRTLRAGMWRAGMWRGGRGNWRNEANWWGEWLSLLGGSRCGGCPASCAGKRGTLRATRCFAKLPRKRIPRVSDGPCDGLDWGVVTQDLGAGRIYRMGISPFSTMGCGHGGRFCDASRWITRTLPGRRRDLGQGAGFRLFMEEAALLVTEVGRVESLGVRRLASS
jgi:hypothetical protein